MTYSHLRIVLHRIGLSVLPFSLLMVFPASAAPLAPDAGQTMRELQQQPDRITPESTTAPLQPQPEPTPSFPPEIGNEQIEVKVIHVSGNKVFASGELEKLVAYLLGAKHTLNELNAGALHITAYYRQRGYLLAHAYLPAQDIKDGMLTIIVMEGLVGQINLHNQSSVSDSLVNQYLSSIRIGEVLQVMPVDRALFLLNDTTGIGSARASLQPGASVGTTDLLVELDPAKPISTNLELDNYGNRYTGEYRLGSALALNSPLKMGDQLTARAVVSGESMGYVRFAYQLPVGGDGLKMGGAYAHTRYGLGKEFAALQAHGTASSASLYATYPFIRSQSNNLSGTLTSESKTLVDQTDAPISSANKKVQLINIGLAGSHQDILLGGGMTAFDTSLVTGKLNMDTASLAIDAISVKSNGAFTKLSYNLNRLQRLTDNDTLSLALSGQQADKNLNSSEKFSLGGANGVRAYPQGEGSGDQGRMVNLEVRHSLMEKLQGMAFYDAGSAKMNHTPFSAATNSRSIAGAGIGLNAQYLNMQIKTSLAWRTNGGKSLSEPTTINRNPRLWLQVGGQF